MEIRKGYVREGGDNIISRERSRKRLQSPLNVNISPNISFNSSVGSSRSPFSIDNGDNV